MERFSAADENGRIQKAEMNTSVHSEEAMNVERCVLCEIPDRDLKSDHLRTLCIDRQGKLHSGYFRPHLGADEAYFLQLGENRVCSNRQVCRERMRVRK